jgi:hypothetical protein
VQRNKWSRRDGVRQDQDGSNVVLRDHIADAVTIEVLALKEGLALARQRGALRVFAETYCLGVVQLWDSFSTQ